MALRCARQGLSRHRQLVVGEPLGAREREDQCAHQGTARPPGARHLRELLASSCHRAGGAPRCARAGRPHEVPLQRQRLVRRRSGAQDGVSILPADGTHEEDALPVPFRGLSRRDDRCALRRFDGSLRRDVQAHDDGQHPRRSARLLPMSFSKDARIVLLRVFFLCGKGVRRARRRVCGDDRRAASAGQRGHANLSGALSQETACALRRA